MVQPRDGLAIRAFLADQGLGIDELELARLLRFDPRRRAVICASALVDGREVVTGLGAIDLDAKSPDLVLVGGEQPKTWTSCSPRRSVAGRAPTPREQGPRGRRCA